MKAKRIVVVVLTVILLLPLFLIRADGDITAPVVTSFEVTPTAADASTQSQTFTLTMTITDDQSGVCVSGDCGSFTGTPTQVRFQSIGTEVLDFYDFTLISGNDKDGQYRATAVMPTGSKVGPWQLMYIFAVDKNGNLRTYLPFQYPDQARQPSDDVFSSIASMNTTAIGNSAEADSVTIDSEYSIINPMNGDKVTFPQGTVITKREGGSFAFYRMLVQDYELDEVSDNGLAGFPLSTLRIGVPGLNVEFSKPVTIEIQLNDLRKGTKLKIQSLGENGDRWANETSCKIDDEACQFTVNHATRFAILGKKKIKLSIKKIPKTTTSSSITVRGKTKKGAGVSVSVNSQIQKTLTAGKGGNYSTSVDLSDGANIIRVIAGNSKGSKTVTKTVTKI